jgi:cytosine/adenosine deaminase-related metal-dependent hydrolase
MIVWTQRVAAASTPSDRRLDLPVRLVGRQEHRAFGGAPGALSAREVLTMATRGGARLLGRDDVGHLGLGMSADFIAIKLDQLGLSGTQRDPLAAMVMCGPFRVSHSIIDGRQIIADGAFCSLDVEALLAEHAATMRRIWQ